MTIATTLNRISYTANGVQVTFPYTFEILKSTDLLVYDIDTLGVVTQVSAGNYTVSGVGAATGGNVTFTIAPTNLHTILIIRVMAQDQQSQLPSNDKFPTVTVETALDKLTMLVQQLSEVDSRCLKMGLTSLFANLTVPDPVAGKFLRWKDLTQLENVDVTGAGSIGIPVSIVNGGTGSAYGSALALLQGLKAAQWQQGADIVAAATITLPNPLDGNLIKITGNTGVSALSTTGVAIGTRLVLWFTGTPLLTHGANFFMLGAVNYQVVANDLIEFELTSATKWQALRIVPQAASAGKFQKDDGTFASPAPLGALSGLKLSNNGGAPTTDIDVAVGEASSDDALPLARVSMALTAALTGKRLDTAWVVGASAGMLDTGVVANNTYHLYLIQRPDTGVVDLLASLSASAPTMPANYTKKRRIGSIVRLAGAIKAFVQDGDYFRWLASVLDVDNTNPGNAAVTRTLTVPTGINVHAIGNLELFDSAAGAIAHLSDLAANDEAPVITAAAPLGMVVVATAGSACQIQAQIRTNTSAQIRSRCGTTTANTIIRWATMGYFDPRGRN